MTTLPYDIARCAGTTNLVCQACRRREPGGDYHSFVSPAMNWTNSYCPNYIPPQPIDEESMKIGNQCPRCGRIVDFNHRNCPYCGRAL